MKTIVMIQARLASSRLPRKVLQDIEGHSMLARVVNRARQATIPDDVVVATTTESTDDELASVCEKQGWSCFRGSNLDVLDRFYQAASAFDADFLVRVSSDCPLVDPEILDRVVGELVNSSGTLDYAANILVPRTFPHGVDVEALTFEALKKSWTDATDVSCREHVTPWIYQNPDRFRIRNVTNVVDESHYRWTVDTPEDLETVSRICRHFGDTDFRFQDVIEACRQHPEWSHINDHIQQRNVHLQQRAA